MANAKIFRINYKSDFILTLVSDAGWMTPFCIKFWTGAPSQAYYVQFDGTTYTHCAPVDGDPTKLLVQFDDHHLPIGELKYQVAYHFTVADFPNDTEDEVLNQANITTEIDGETYQVMLDFTGETAPEIQFSLPAYANEAQRIANEEQRIGNEQARIEAEQQRIDNEQTRQDNEAQRIAHEASRVNEYAELKTNAVAATNAANYAATLAAQKAQLAADKAALADAAATLAAQKAQLAADKAALADAAATLANQKAALAQQKAEYAQTQGDYAKAQGDYAKEQGEIAEEDHERAEEDHTRAESDHATAGSDHTQAGTDHSTAVNDHTQSVTDHTQADTDHTRADSDHTQAASDHTQAGADHTRAENDHSTASADHTQAGQDHTRAESDHTRAESDHAAVELYIDSLGAFDISAYHATGGVLAKYADLTAALGTNGANIPEAIRKGGMSVKFVQTYDNKYVQYMLIKSQWSINPTDWQMVGVKDLSSDIVTSITGNDVNAGYIYNTGEIYPSANAVHDERYFKVMPGLVLYFRKPTDYRVSIAKYDSGKQFVGTTGWNDSDIYIIPDNIYYVRVNFNKSGGLTPSNFSTVLLKGSFVGANFDVTRKSILTSNGWADDVKLASDYEFESGSYNGGSYVQNTKRIRTTIYNVNYVRSISVSSSYRIAYYIIRKDGTYVNDVSFGSNIVYPDYVEDVDRLIVILKKSDNTDFSGIPSDLNDKIYLRQSVPYDYISHDVTLVNGTWTSGHTSSKTNRLRTDLIPFKSIIIPRPSNYYVSYSLFDKDMLLVLQSNWYSNEIKLNANDYVGYVGIVYKKTDESDILPSDISVSVQVISPDNYSISQVISKQNKNTIKLIAFNTIPANTGNIGKYYYYDNELRYISSNSGYSVIDFTLGGFYVFDGKIYTWNGTELELLDSGGIPEGGTEGQVLTPDGWSSDYPTSQDVQASINDAVDDATEDLVSNTTLATILRDYETAAHAAQELNDCVKNTDQVSNIAPNAVGVSNLSQAVLDLIEASGEGTITNNPDDIDIETNQSNQLQLKGGGVVRFRIKSTPADNATELARCVATGLPIQIENSVNLANSDGSIRDITFNGETLVFVGNGQIKNCHVSGNVYIQANKSKIFDNVYFHHWTVSGVSQINGSSIYETELYDTTYDVYNRKTKELSSSSVTTTINPFICSLTRSKIGSFASPVLQDGKYVYKEGNTVKLTFEDDGEGNVKLPIRKDYLFLDNGVVKESTYDIKTKTPSYTYVAVSNLTISRLFAPTKINDGIINGDVYPEWWGAKNDSSYDSNTAFQCALLHSGNLCLSSIYYVSGNLRMYGNLKISGNKSTITLLSNSTSSCMFEIETLSEQQNGIIIYDLSLNGNKEHQIIEQDGIFADFGKGLQPFSGYSINNTYWYNMFVENFTGSGICVAVPGTSHIYSSYLADNGVDGITWDNEHFTLTNVSCVRNGRHGAYASGNHWRIIGGAYAHNNAGDNIYCDGAFEAQIIGCSCIDSGEFVEQAGGGYIASSQNIFGYIWAGEGQGTHALIGGNGINLRNCHTLTISCVRINQQNANGILIYGGYRITVSECQFNQNNMTKTPDGMFSDINGNLSALYIANCYYNGAFEVTNQVIFPESFGTSSQQGDWNNIKGTIGNFRQSIFYVADYYNASNRPSDAGTYLEGTIHVKDGLSKTVGRTYIRLSDNLGNQYFRYVTINYSTGAYSDDSGWKKIFSA